MALRLRVNGRERVFQGLTLKAPVSDLVAELGFRQDRVAVECNGEIVPRAQWAATPLNEDDKLEVVHFVGGGAISYQ